MHRSPASFPSGIPGMGVEIEGEIQQAPHPDLQSMIIPSGVSYI